MLFFVIFFPIFVSLEPSFYYDYDFLSSFALITMFASVALEMDCTSCDAQNDRGIYEEIDKVCDTFQVQKI